MTVQFKKTKFIEIILKLHEKKYTFLPDKCPEEITFDMLKKELRPEGKLVNTNQNRLALWKCFYITSLSPNQYGFYSLRNIGNRDT